MSKTKAVQKTESPAKRFTSLVINEFRNLPGSINLTDYQRELIQHLFLKIEMYLKDPKNQYKSPPVSWSNINLPELALAAVDRVRMDLDALIPNHIHPIAYAHNDKKGNFIDYTLNLQIGYIGWDYMKRTIALNPPADITYRLVHKNDTFTPLPKDKDHPFDQYLFKIADNAFDRGPVIGGFGYIEYEEPKMNKLVIVSEKEFLASRERCKDPKKTFWNDFPDQMRFSKLVMRTVSDKNIPPDPKKCSLSYMRIQEEQILQEIEENANQELIDIEPCNGEISPIKTDLPSLLEPSAQKENMAPYTDEEMKEFKNKPNEDKPQQEGLPLPKQSKAPF